jgi:hypothetical protein
MTMDIDPMEASRYRHASFCASIPGGIGAAEIQQFATQAEKAVPIATGQNHCVEKLGRVCKLELS